MEGNMKDNALLGIIRRYPFLSFLVFTFLISWIPWFAGQGGVFVYGPSIAGIAVIALLHGKDGIKNVMKKAIRGRVHPVWWVAALLLPCILTLGAICVNSLMGQRIPEFTFLLKEWYLAPVFFISTIIGGPLGEEFGWRGFALPCLQKKSGPLLASVIIGAVWGVWHIPQFFTQGTFHYVIGLSLLPVFVAGEIMLSTIMCWIYNKTKGSLLLGGFLFHNADNFWGVVLMTGVTMSSALSGGGSESTLDMRLWTISIIVYAVFAIMLVAATKGRLGYKPEQEAIPFVSDKNVTAM
jgi:uncharacterized protein